MSNTPIRDMTQTGTPDASSLIVFDNGTMRKGTVGSMADAVRPVASQSEAQVGSDNAKVMTPLRVKESIASEVGVSLASKAQGDLANTALQPGNIGGSVQAHDTDLDAIAALTPTNDDLMQRKAGAWTNRTLAQVKTDLALNNVDNTSDATKWAATATLTNKTFDTAGTGNSLLINGVAVTANTGTGAVVRATSPALTTPNLGTPSAVTLTNATGLPIATGVANLGTGIATALAVNVGTAGAPVINGGALGTPASGTLTNATGLPIATGVANLGTGVATFLTTPSSANLRAALTDEVGTGAAYFVGGALGTPASGTATNLTGLPLTTGVTGTLPKSNGGLGAITLSSALDTEFTSTQGSILYRNAAQWVALTPGTAGQFLTTQGAAANPNWSSGGAGTGTVTSVTLGAGYGISVSGTNPITASGTFTPAVGLSSITNSLGATVALNNISNYFDGPSVAQGTSGTWFCSGYVTFNDTSAPAQFHVKLWDGTTVIAAAVQTTAAAGYANTIHLSGIISSPAANIKISVKDVSSTAGVIQYNITGTSKDSTLTCVRIA